MSRTDATVEEVVNSLTGFDELAIEKHFSLALQDIESKPTTFARALVFVVKRREGLDDAAAKKAAMELPLGEVNTYFSEDDEVDPEDPVTPSGEGGAPLA